MTKNVNDPEKVLEIISNQKNSYLVEVYELVVNNNEVNEDDIMFI